MPSLAPSQTSALSVSIIVPVFNVELLLPRCLDSLALQSLPDIEVILIDDGSTDRSLEICKRYASQHKNWVVRTKANEGQGVARNIGMEIARGEYVIFVDSDDWIESSLCEEVVEQLRDSGADFANFGFDFFTVSEKVKKRVAQFSSSRLEGSDIFHNALLDKDVLSISWNKMYKRTLFQNQIVFFPPLRANEDLYFSRAIAHSSKSCIFINKVFYHALIRPGSTSRSMSVNLYKTTSDLFQYEEQRFDLSNATTKELFDCHVVKLWSYLIVQGSFRIKEDIEFFQCLSIAEHKHFSRFSKDNSIIRHLSPKNRLMLFLCRRPKTLRMLTRIASKLGIQPY